MIFNNWRWLLATVGFAVIYAFSAPQFVLMASQEDCVVNSVTLQPSTSHPGEQVTASFTVRNAGATDAFAMIASVWFPPSPIHLEDQRFNLAAYEERTLGPYTLNMPADLTAGIYNFEACVNAYDYHYKNCKISPLKIESSFTKDLVMDALSSKTQIIYPNVYFEVSATIANRGNTSSKHQAVSLYLSSDSVITKDDIPVGNLYNSNALDPENSRTLTGDARLFMGSNVSPPPPGNYYLGSCVSSLEINADVNDANDCRSIPVQLLSESLTTDLSIQNVRLSIVKAIPGDSFTTYVEIYDGGPAGAGHFDISAEWVRSPDLPVHLATSRFDGVINAGKTTTVPISIQVPAGSPTGQYVLTVCLDSKNEVVEKYEDNNCRTYGGLFSVEGLRELQVASIQVNPSSAESRQKVDITYRVKSSGFKLNTEPMNAVLWSKDASVSSDDVQIAQSYLHLYGYDQAEQTATVQVTVPFSSKPGVYYIGLCTDWLDWVREADESNNCVVAPFTVKESGTQPLSFNIELISDVINAAPGDTVHFFVSATNTGGTPTGAIQWFFNIVDFPDEHANYFSLGSATMSSLQVGESKLLGPITLQVPKSVWVKRAYITALASASSIQYYRAEALDFFYVDTMLPTYDLKASLGVMGRRNEERTSLFLNYEIRNLSAALHSSTRASIQWSPNPDMTAQDPEIATFQTPPIDGGGGSDTGHLAIDVKGLTDPAYVRLCLDATNSLPEANEDNNCVTTKVNMAPSDEGYVDVKIADMSLDMIFGEQGAYVSAFFRIQNDGNASTYYDKQTEYGVVKASIRWSTASVISETDPVLGSITISALNAGEGIGFTKQLQIPNQSAGRYYIGVCVEQPKGVFERNTVNNCASVPIEIRSPKTIDLQIPQVVLDLHNVISGDVLGVSFKVKNNGNSPASDFGSAIRWSEDPVINNADLVIRRLYFSGMNAGASFDVGPVKINVPGGLRPGTHYVAVCADSYFDSGNRVVETDEGNNCSFATVTVAGSSEPQRQSIHLAPSSAGTIQTNGKRDSVITGFAFLESNSGRMPAGSSIYAFRQNGAVVSEVGVPSSPPSNSTLLFVESRKSIENSDLMEINTGVAVANPGSHPSIVAFIFRDLSGSVIASGSMSLESGSQIACFLDQLEDFAPEFKLPDDISKTTFYGTMEVSGSEPISVLALRLQVNERGETLLSSTPVADLSAATNNRVTSIPRLADGGGYTTTILLMNTSENVESGRVQFWDEKGLPLSITFSDGTAGTELNYSILAKGGAVFQTIGTSPGISVGAVDIVPNANSTTPEGSAIFSLKQNGIRVTETAVRAGQSAYQMRMYVDSSAPHDTGIAVYNPQTVEVEFDLHLLALDGRTLIGAQTVRLPPHGNLGRFVSELFPGLPGKFQGQIRINVKDKDLSINALPLRSLINERGEFLLTTLPILDVQHPPTGQIVFPQIADGGGYTTEIILINPDDYGAVDCVFRFEQNQGLFFSLAP
jgi:hypothetical protein